jgi:hypothetical protein
VGATSPVLANRSRRSTVLEATARTCVEAGALGLEAAAFALLRKRA